MLSKERFLCILLLISVVCFVVAVNGLLTGCPINNCNNLILIWISIGGFTTVIFSKFSSPRRGRYTFSVFIGLGCTIIQLVLFVQRYSSCNWNFLICDRNATQLRASIAEDTARAMAAFDAIYRLCALMMLSLGSAYTLSFKQHLAWNTILLLIAHYNLFAVIMTFYFNSDILRVNLFAVLSCLALVFATELLNRTGRNRAQAKVLEDYTSRTKLWSDMIKEHDFSEQIKRLKDTISRGSLAAVCEPLDPKTKKLVPKTVLQPHADIDRLYCDCSALNYFFQDWVRTWFPSGTRSDEFEFCNPRAPYKEAFKIHVANCFPDIVRGPIKAPNRVISKVALAIMFPCRYVFPHVHSCIIAPRRGVLFDFCCPALCVRGDVTCQVYRSYRGRVDRVTDVIRCAIVFTSVDELVRFMKVYI